MKQYTTAFKARVLQRLVGPRAISAYRLAAEVGVSQVTLSRWLAATRSVPSMTIPAKKWTGAQKLRVILATHGLSETALGALLRREGLHAAQLDEWRTAAETALEEPSGRREKATPHPDTTLPRGLRTRGTSRRHRAHLSACTPPPARPAASCAADRSWAGSGERELTGEGSASASTTRAGSAARDSRTYDAQHELS